jgi:hypothetical protein
LIFVLAIATDEHGETAVNAVRGFDATAAIAIAVADIVSPRPQRTLGRGATRDAWPSSAMADSFGRSCTRRAWRTLRRAHTSGCLDRRVDAAPAAGGR